MNVLDLASIQESLDCYLKLIKWMPVTNKVEAEMKDQRIEIVEYLMRKCESEILLYKRREEKNEQSL